MLPLPAAVLFDLDGTLIDSEAYWIEVETEIVTRHGGTWTHTDGLELIGSDLRHTARVLREQGGVQGEDDEIIDQLVDGVARCNEARGVHWRPGALELIRNLNREGVPCAIVTMSYRRLAETVLRELPDGAISVVVSGDDVSRGKPHPEPYLRAAERLGVDPKRCVGIEDSPTGIASVEASGARSVGVPFLVHLHRAPGRSRVPSLAELTIEDLRLIAHGDVIDRVELP